MNDLLVRAEVVDRRERLGADVARPLLGAAVLDDGLHRQRDLEEMADNLLLLEVQTKFTRWPPSR